MKRAKTIRNVILGIVALLLVISAGLVIVVQTDSFHNFVREKIITATEEGTGGRVEVQSFSFDWRHLEAVVTGFVIHGTEPAGAEPFMRAGRVQVNIRLLTSMRRFLDVSLLLIEQPQVNILVAADGSTNILTPRKRKAASDKAALDAVIDLAVDRFEARNGSFSFNSLKQPIDVTAKNLRAQLLYNVVGQSYRGEISLQPIYIASGRNTPVEFTVRLPVVIERHRVALDNARISTAGSELSITGSLVNPDVPAIACNMGGHLALTDLKKVANFQTVAGDPGLPSRIDIQAKATVTDRDISVADLRLSAGRSEVRASGTLKDPDNKGALRFTARLALAEVGRLADLTARPAGTISAEGTAKLDAQHNYAVEASVAGHDITFAHAERRIGPLELATAIHLDPHLIDVRSFRLAAYGGDFTGNASLAELSRYQLSGTLRNLALQTVAAALGQKLPYTGVISGPVEAQGDLEAAGISQLKTNARLDIVPKRGGVPVSGRLYADFDGATDNLNVDHSFIKLPHTRLSLTGLLNRRLDLQLTSTDLNDVFGGRGRSMPVALENGQASFTGTLTGGSTAPQIAGHFTMGRFRLDGRRFDSAAFDVAAAKAGVSVRNGSIGRGEMQARFAVSAALQDWSPKPKGSLAANVVVSSGDLADLAALTVQTTEGYLGAFNMNASIGGTLGNPTGSANLNIGKGTIAGEAFDQIKLQVNLADQVVTLPVGTIAAGEARATMNAEYRHPRDSFTTGQLHVGVQAKQIELAQLRTLQQQRPNTAGLLNLDATLSGSLNGTKTTAGTKPQFALASVNANVSAHSLRVDGENYGDLDAKARTNGQAVNYDLVSNFAGSDLKIAGTTQFVNGYPTTATAYLSNLPVERLLTLAKRQDIRVKGRLSGNARMNGTLENPEGTVDGDLASAVLYDEHVDHLRVRANYAANSIDVPRFELISGSSKLELAARYRHPAGNMRTGDLEFRIDSSLIELGRFRNIERIRPGLSGKLRIAANGIATLQERAPLVLFRTLDADIVATELKAQGTDLGSASVKANTSAGVLKFALDTDIARAAIAARGDARLSGDYPVNAQLTFQNVSWSGVQRLMGRNTGQPARFDGLTEGELTVSGPVTKPEQLQAKLQIPRLRLTTISQSPKDKPVVLENQGPLIATLDQGIVRIQNAHLTGPKTDVTASGSASLVQQQALDVELKGNTNLALVQSFSSDIYSSGTVSFGATVRGTVQKPAVNGQLELKNASIYTTEFPNTISNANGSIIFSGSTATIRDLTAESGGGKVTLGGYVSLEDKMRLGLRARVENVRVRPQSGISVVVSSNLRLTGTRDASLASGNITINTITYAPQSDLGSLLTRSAPPVQSPTAPAPFLENMKLDIRVRSSSATTVQASLAQNLQFDTDLRIRGTAAQPGILGRVTVTEGDLAFFGSSYRVSSGTISFYNPVRIEPVLNVTLETQAKSVDVVLTVTGPIDNMKLSYTSDPPLQFQEIVALLAAGKTPTSDPTVLANQPSAPQQSFEQMGESAILSKAIADPVASRMQRVFGVSQLKIDPSFTNGSDLPQARVTLQQQVASNLTFTYVTALDDPNTQIVRIEWSLNPQWSAAATRDENGIVSISFLYKRQFR